MPAGEKEKKMDKKGAPNLLDSVFKITVSAAAEVKSDKSKHKNPVSDLKNAIYFHPGKPFIYKQTVGGMAVYRYVI